MRTVVSTLALLGSINMAMAETYIYVSKAPEETIQVFRLDMTNGKLTPVEAIAVKGAPGSLATNPAKTVLFASLRTTSSLASFRIDPKTGKLSHLSTAPLDPLRIASFFPVVQPLSVNQQSPFGMFLTVSKQYVKALYLIFVRLIAN